MGFDISRNGKHLENTSAFLPTDGHPLDETTGLRSVHADAPVTATLQEQARASSVGSPYGSTVVKS
jgi:hypothetical protein